MATSWVTSATADHEFSLQNLPYGIFSAPGLGPRAGVAVGDSVLDLAAAQDAGLLSDIPGLEEVAFDQPCLNEFMATPRATWQATRARLTALLAVDGDARLSSDEALQAKVLVPMASVTMHLPAKIGDYTDFYSSREHATNGNLSPLLLLPNPYTSNT